MGRVEAHLAVMFTIGLAALIIAGVVYAPDLIVEIVLPTGMILLGVAVYLALYTLFRRKW